MARKVFRKGTHIDEVVAFCEQQVKVYAVKIVWDILQANNISENDVKEGKWKTNSPELLDLIDEECFDLSSISKYFDIDLYYMIKQHVRRILIEDFLSNGFTKKNENTIEFVKDVAFPDLNFAIELFFQNPNDEIKVS